ncbi:MAG: selenium cofactor biosynthesis protein YqeC [Thermodesulfobacteriota bacterium]
MNRLFSALALTLPEMAILVGSGGKTSLMFTLAAEASRQGIRVLTTTTTKIFPPTPVQSPRLVLAAETADLEAELRRAFEESPLVTAADGLNQEGKLTGLPPEIVDRLFINKVADLIIVEADGAKHRPLKAPGPHEPVIPSFAGLVVPVIGLGGLGKKLDDETVFRAGIFARLSGLARGEPVTAETVARVVFHPEGLCRDAPRRARLIPFLNQADLLEAEAAKTAAAVVYGEAKGRADRVVWGSLLPEPDLNVWP